MPIPLLPRIHSNNPIGMRWAPRESDQRGGDALFGQEGRQARGAGGIARSGGNAPKRGTGADRQDRLGVPGRARQLRRERLLAKYARGGHAQRHAAFHRQEVTAVRDDLFHRADGLLAGSRRKRLMKGEREAAGEQLRRGQGLAVQQGDRATRAALTLEPEYPGGALGQLRESLG